jgi:hypothetical protein
MSGQPGEFMSPEEFINPEESMSSGESMSEAEHKRAFGVFSDPQQAEASFHQLNASGFPMDHVSLVVKQADEGEKLSGVEVHDQIGDQSVKTPLGVVEDTFAHSSWGFVLVGLTSLALPGIGPVLAAGSLGAALVATTASMGISTVAINQLVKALSDLGIPKAQASVYSDHLLQGNYFVMVEGTPDEIGRAEQILSDQGVQDWSVYAAA